MGKWGRMVDKGGIRGKNGDRRGILAISGEAAVREIRGRGAATQGQSKMMDDVLQAASAPGQWRENAIGEPFREHLSPTQTASQRKRRTITRK